ncbi:MAG TPA: class I SAM-dependent methyltransferase [Rubrivivax sp.]|nr:class I SAM-dependent methyltransferase [Rubrivivax sp.]
MSTPPLTINATSVTRVSSGAGWSISVAVEVTAPVVFWPRVVVMLQTPAGPVWHDSAEQTRIGWLPRGHYRFALEGGIAATSFKATLICKQGFGEIEADCHEGQVPAPDSPTAERPFWRIDTPPPSPPLGVLSWSKGHSDWFYRHFDHAALTVIGYLLGESPLLKGRILDVGCGDGITDLSIALRTQCQELVGVDPFKGYERLPGMMRDNHVPAEAWPTNLRFLPADANHLPFEDDSFDVVISWGSLEHIAGGYLQAMREIKRVLKPDGLFMVHPGLYFSNFGHHLGEFSSEPFFHLKKTPEEVHRIVMETPPRRIDRAGHIATPAEYWQWYNELNPITISRFEAELRALEFEPWRVAIRTEDLIEYTPELQKYPMQDLASLELYVSCVSRKKPRPA